MFYVRPSIVAIAFFSVTSTWCAYSSTTRAEASDALTAVGHSGSGHILRGSLGTQPSLKAATIALLTRVHDALGNRPTVVKILQNAAQHTVAVFFTDTQGGRPVTGMSIVTAAPGLPASGAVVYDTSVNFPKSSGPLLHALGAAAPAGGGGGQRLAMVPPEPLIPHPFADNTGTIGVPADWTLKGAGGGSAVAIGPSGELVNYQYTTMANDPSYGLGQQLANGTGIYANTVLRSAALSSTALLHYTGDPVQAWETSFDQMAMQRSHKHGTIFKIDSVKKINDHVDFITGSGNITGGGAYAPGEVTYFAYASVLPVNHIGQWVMVYSYCIVPKKQVKAHGATAAAVFNSVRINTAQIAANLKAFDDMMQQQFESRLANVREQDAIREQGTQDSIARANANSDVMQRQAAGMENYALDRTVVADPDTGAHVRFYNSDLGTPVNYQVVPPSDYIKGVDY